MDKSLIRCFGISILVLTISGCSNTSQVGQNGLITGVNESDIEKANKRSYRAFGRSNK